MQNDAQYYEQVLQLARSVSGLIDAVAQRGGFKGEELSTVGGMRDSAARLVAATEQRQSDAAEEAE
jgi:hypothetical protein